MRVKASYSSDKFVCGSTCRVLGVVIVVMSPVSCKIVVLAVLVILILVFMPLNNTVFEMVVLPWW